MEDLRNMTPEQLRKFRLELEAENAKFREKERSIEKMLKRHEKERKAIGL